MGGGQGLHLIFEFRDLYGEKLLYEENQRLYFEKYKTDIDTKRQI